MYWYRNSVEMSVSSDRMTISNVFVELENIGTQSAPVMVATRNTDGTFKTYTNDNKPSGAISVVYIVDDLDADSGDSVATNILYNVDSVRFSDDVEFEL